MFMSLITFYLEYGYKLDIENNEILINKDEYRCYIRVHKFDGRMCYVFENRFFKSREIAESVTKKLYDSIRKQLIRRGIPIWYKNYDYGFFINSDSYYPAKIEPIGYEKPELIAPNLKNKRIAAEVIGYEIFELRTPIDDIKVIRQDVKFERTYELEPFDIEDQSSMNDTMLTAYKVLNLSNLVSDAKLSFILKITALEVIVSDSQYKPDKIKKAISQINKKILKVDNILEILQDKSEEMKNEIISLKAGFGSMNKLSILEKCRNLISDNYYIEEFFKGKSSIEFFNDCYNIRSKFVHAGEYNITEISEKVMKLDELIKKVLENVCQ